MNFKPTSETLRIVERLGGHWTGRNAMVNCPAHDDRTPSLSIRQGQSSILVHCFAGCEGADVMRALRQVLGHPIADRQAMPDPASDRAALVQRLWDEALPIEGTLGQRYLLEVRGITFLPPDVRFHPRCPMGKGAEVRFLPALLVGVFRRGRLIAVQRLFLESSTAQRTARMMLGNSRGGTWPSRFSGGTTRVAEGFESACAFWQVTGREAGTCFGVRNWANFEPSPDTTVIVLLPDNDVEGLTFAHSAAAQRRATGSSASIVRCPGRYGDWADMIKPSAQTKRARCVHT